jgi:hypothetical protein
MRKFWAATVVLACTLALPAFPAVAGATTGRGTPRGTARVLPWDPKLAPIAAEVESIRGLKFEKAVPVHYLGDKAFEKRLLGDDPKPNAAGKRELQRVELRLRALGLLDHDVDLHASTRTAAGSGTLAFYDPASKNVYVRGTDTTAPATRVTLAHELTHALQDQHFDLQKIQRNAAVHGNESVVKAIIEGDASYVQEKFASKLSDASQLSYAQTQSAEVSDARALDVPEVIKVEMGAPYALGEALVNAIWVAKGRSGVDALFRKPPASELAFVDPTTVLQHATTVKVAAPKLGPRDKADGGATSIGAFGLFELLSSRLPVVDAMNVAGLWRGDRLVQFRQDGRTCVRVDFAGADHLATVSIQQALGSWADASPATGASVTAVTQPSPGGAAELTSCAPSGASTPIPAGTMLDATQLLSERNALMPELAAVGSPERARCVATDLVSDTVFRQILDDANAGRLTATEAQSAVVDRMTSLRDGIMRDCT